MARPFPSKSVLAAALAASLLLPAAAAAKELTFSFSADVRTFDPHSFNEAFNNGFLSNFYEGLVARDPDLAFIPSLATSWELVEPTRWRFKLREGVKFHNGEDFTAEDVVFSFERARADGSDVKGRLGNITEAVAVDDHTVDLVTEAPNPIAFYELDGLYIMDSGWAEEQGSEKPASLESGADNVASREINGTGPYRLVSYEPDVKIVAEANPDWWGAADTPVAVDSVIYRPIASDATRVAALITGEIDLTMAVPLQDIPRLEQTEGIKVLRVPEVRVVFLGLDQFRPKLMSNEADNPFRDKKVREALYRAIDVDTIGDKIMRGLSKPTALLASPEVEGGVQSGIDRYGYDIEAAKALIQEAGVPEGFSFELVCPNDRYVNDEAICQAVAGMWAQIGLDTKVSAIPRAQWAQRLLGSDFDAYLLGWTPSSLDSWNIFFNILRCKNEAGGAGGTMNFAGYCNPELDALADKIISETDVDQRRAMVAEAWEMMHEDVAYIPLHQQMVVWAAKDAVEVTPRPDAVLQWRWVDIAE